MKATTARRAGVPLQVGCLVLVWWMSGLWSVARAVDREALLKLVGVPTPTLDLAFAWSDKLGFAVGDPLAGGAMPQRDLGAELRVLETELATRRDEPELWLKLREVQAQRGETNAAREASARAETLLRARLAAQPTNGWIVAQLAGSLVLPDAKAEVDRLLDEAVRLSPEDHRVWRAYASGQIRASFSDLGPHVGSFTSREEDLGALAVRAREWLDGAEVTTAQRNQALGRVRRAREALARAVQAPQADIETLMTRWMFETVLAPVFESLFAGRQDKSDTTSLAMFDRGVMDNLLRASRLATNEPYAAAMAALMLTTVAVVTSDSDAAPMQTDIRGLLSPSDRAFLSEVQARLEISSSGSAHPAAAQALLTRGFLEAVVAGNPTNAAELALRADELDVRNVAALPLAVVSLSTSGQQERAVRAADTLVERRDLPLARIIRAKVLARAREYGRAGADLREVLRIQPTNTMARVGLAALDVLGSEASRLEPAAETLERLENEPAVVEDKSLRNRARLTRAAALALAGKPSVARRVLYSILTESPSDADARKALEAIGRD